MKATSDMFRQHDDGTWQPVGHLRLAPTRPHARRNTMTDTTPKTAGPHWLTHFDEDGEPDGEVCNCDINADHLASGRVFP